MQSWQITRDLELHNDTRDEENTKKKSKQPDKQSLLIWMQQFTS